tara:strand:- start:522 stop:794 length:273 start_codon:yes stop_codon:yes gene_type:complete
MSIVAVIARIMPSSPQTDLESIKTAARTSLENQGAKNLTFEEKPIAFGLKALELKFAWPEEKDTDLIENSLSEIEGVGSATLEDYRRAFG